MTDRVHNDMVPAVNAFLVMVCSIGSWITSVIGALNHVLELGVLVANMIVAFFTVRYLIRKTRKLDSASDDNPKKKNSNGDD